MIADGEEGKRKQGGRQVVFCQRCHLPCEWPSVIEKGAGEADVTVCQTCLEIFLDSKLELFWTKGWKKEKSK